MVPKVQMVGSRRRGTAIKPKGWDGSKTESEVCGTARGGGWVFQTLGLMGSGPQPIGSGCAQVAKWVLLF